MRDTARATTTSQPNNRAPNEPAMNKNAKFGHFGAKNRNSYWRNQKFFSHITETPPRHVVRIGFWSGMGRYGQKMTIFGPK